MPPGRNDPCPCGSGDKFKKCCLPLHEAAAVAESGWLRMRRTEGELIGKMAPHLARHYGPDALNEAWQEYTLWPEEPADPEQWPEFETSFLAWLVFDWDPDELDDDGPRERPVIPAALHYTEQRGGNLDSYERRYIDAACGAPFSFYLILATEPGRAITLRDILRRQEVTVRERQASSTLQPGQIVFTKVVAMDGEAVMLGCAPYAIPANRFDAIVELREYIASHGEPDAEALREHDIEMRELYLDLREDIIHPAAPVMENTDGDPIQLTRIDYELDCSPQDAFAALLPLTLKDDPELFAGDMEHDRAGVLIAAKIPWLRPGNPRNPGWPNTLLGNIEIRRGRLSVNVNSQARADAIQAELAARLGARARLKGAVVESLEQLAAAAAEAGHGELRQREADELQQAPEVQVLMATMNAEHWRTWPDIALPALGGQTPRQAAKTPTGRERLEVLLLDFTAREGVPGILGPDIGALRRELGL